jgi:cytoskeletal protein CcmA (bactofilin family)
VRVVQVRRWAAAAVAAVAASCGGRFEPGGGVERGGDLVAWGREVAVADSVPGDVMAAGRTLDVGGAVGGDLLAAGARVALRGVVGSDVRAAGREVRIGARVGRNVTAAGERVVLEPEAEVGGNAYLAGRRVEVAGRTSGLLRVAGAEVVLRGRAGGDVRVEADRLVVEPGAVIAGDLRYRVSDRAVVDAGARVEGRVVELPRARARLRWPGSLVGAAWRLGFLLVGLVAVLVFPGPVDRVAEALGRRLGASLGLGLAWLVLAPVAAVLAAATVVGFPLALVLFGTYALSLYLARVATAVWLGRAVLGRRAGAGRAARVGAFAIGGAALVGLGFVPWVGSLAHAAAAGLGCGAAALAMRGRT